MLAQDPRTEDAPRAAGLTVLERVDYTFMGGRKPHIATLVCAKLPPYSVTSVLSPPSYPSYSLFAGPSRFNGSAEGGEQPQASSVDRAFFHMLIRDAVSGEFTKEHLDFKREMLKEGPL
jgi:hypothetical protein